jgi:hypothetical protein
MLGSVSHAPPVEWGKMTIGSLLVIFPLDTETTDHILHRRCKI